MHTNHISKFGLIDYVRMYQKYGFKIIYKYFIEAHLFDLLHGTDTHRRVFNTCERDVRPYEYGEFYMACWTSIVRKAFNTLRIFESDLQKYTFIDLGCGKGKVLFLWQMYLNKFGLRQSLYGIDYSNQLIDVANRNMQKLNLSGINLICDSALNVKYNDFGPTILFLNNPFGRDLLSIVLNKIKTVDLYIIYVNPNHSELFDTERFKLVYQQAGFHPNCFFKIYKTKL